MQRLQELGFGRSYDYRIGSPHLRHWALYERLVAALRAALADLAGDGLPLTVLEVGAGHGGYTEPMLASGCQVTATEMSRPSLERLSARFGANANLRTLFDEDGSLDVVGPDRFSLVLAVSVLHHIPDYVAFVRRAVTEHLRPGGTFMSIQDPLWYPRVPRSTRRFERGAFVLWRVSRGNLRVGASTFVRRLRGVYDEQNPADMVEYHVVRQGVDEQALASYLEGEFAQCAVTAYWSHQAPAAQAVGERLRLANTFMVRADGYRGPT